jgi:hypothetical protein
VPPKPAALKAARSWKVVTEGKTWGEFEDPAHLRAWGVIEFPELLERAPIPSEDGARFGDEPHRFGALARELWEPLLRVEVRG